jgi:16S rRNA processing protein RimM
MADNGAIKAPDDLIELGRIVSAYGVKGWVKVQPHSAQAEVLRAAPVWWLCSPAPPPVKGTQVAAVAAAMRAYPVKQVRPQGASVVACLTGIDDRDIAEAMRGYTVHVSRKDFPAARTDEFYWVDLVGCMVFGPSDHASDLIMYGQVSEVVDNGAHALLRVNLLEQKATDSVPLSVLDAKGKPVDILIPFVSVHVPHVDIVARRIETNWPLGF